MSRPNSFKTDSASSSEVCALSWNCQHHCRARLYRPALWHTIGALAAPKCHQAPRLRTTKSLCLHVVGRACWCDAWTFNPLVGQRQPFAPPSLSRAADVARVRFPAPDAPKPSIRIQYSRAGEGVGAPRPTLQRLRSIISQRGFSGLLQFVREKGAVGLPALAGPSLLAPSTHGEH